MISVNGYFDGSIIRTLEKLNARKNQRIIITLLDEDIKTNDLGTNRSAAGSLAQYANPDLLPLEDGVWERTVKDNYENS